ncbi:NADAR domain-containing protein [Aphelenchoides besseyi]|nr:NADAR domain-containing protein [Aphelenchoides besseyi]
MGETRIVLVGNENDVLHCAHNFALSEGGKRYPSADHYAHSMILASLHLDEVHILELLATPSTIVAKKARELLRENMPQGHDLNSLQSYLVSSRQSYTMQGLRLRAEQDKNFRKTLMDTKSSLLIVCDRRDAELGIGMDEDMFVDYMKAKNANYPIVSQWMLNSSERPPELGQNQLGFFLMWLRYEIRQKELSKWLNNTEIEMDGLNSDSDGSKLKISASNLVIALEGIFKPLSNYYASQIEMKGEFYRSVEHYAYQRLFEALKLDDSEIMRLRTTVRPADLSTVANRIIRRLKLDMSDVTHKKSKMDRWRQSAMKHKFSKNDFLQQLLLSTGFAILLEYTEADDYRWVSSVDEFELQHLLTKRYITPNDIVDWMCERADPPKVMSHLVGNRSGIFLMELRRKFAIGNTNRIPLVSPLKSNAIRSGVSNHMICFTPESVLHPLYPAEIRVDANTNPLVSPIHYVVQKACKFFEIDKETEELLLSTKDTLECWSNLHVLLNERSFSLDKIQLWYMTERQNALKDAMRYQLQQHPPLLRVLLDTEDALLVCCWRFSSSEAELSVGMRERDFRMWCSQVRLNTKQLIDVFLRPMAFRPPYVGGNRIGLMLMELRREFILNGVFPHQLPELVMSADAVFGSESPLENYVPHQEFEILDDVNFTALWANPLILMSKLEPPESELDINARSVKIKPPLTSLNDEDVNRLINQQHRQKRAYFRDKTMAETNVEVLRGSYAKYVHLLRAGILRDLRAQRILNFWSKHGANIQAHRRLVEGRSQTQPLPPFVQQPPLLTVPPRMNPWINSQGPILDTPMGMKEPIHDPNRMMNSYAKHGNDQQPDSSVNFTNEQADQMRSKFERRDRDWDRRDGRPMHRDRSFRNNDDRNRRNNDGFHRHNRFTQQQRIVQNQTQPRPQTTNSNSTKSPAAAKSAAPPPSKKPKREVREEDLSEGEIVSSEED